MSYSEEFISRNVLILMLICVVYVLYADPPKIVGPPAGNVSLSIGGSYVLNCSATGIPVPNVVWTKNGELIPQTVTAKTILI